MRASHGLNGVFGMVRYATVLGASAMYEAATTVIAVTAIITGLFDRDSADEVHGKSVQWRSTPSSASPGRRPVDYLLALCPSDIFFAERVREAAIEEFAIVERVRDLARHPSAEDRRQPALWEWPIMARRMANARQWRPRIGQSRIPTAAAADLAKDPDSGPVAMPVARAGLRPAPVTG